MKKWLVHRTLCSPLFEVHAYCPLHESRVYRSKDSAERMTMKHQYRLNLLEPMFWVFFEQESSPTHAAGPTRYTLSNSWSWLQLRSPIQDTWERKMNWKGSAHGITSMLIKQTINTYFQGLFLCWSCMPIGRDWICGETFGLDGRHNVTWIQFSASYQEPAWTTPVLFWHDRAPLHELSKMGLLLYEHEFGPFDNDEIKS